MQSLQYNITLTQLHNRVFDYVTINPTQNKNYALSERAKLERLKYANS